MSNNARDAAAGVLDDIMGTTDAPEISDAAPVLEDADGAATAAGKFAAENALYDNLNAQASATASPEAEANDDTAEEQMPAQPVVEEMPDDLKALLAEVDDELPADPEPEEEEPEDELPDEDVYKDPEVAKLEKKLAAAQKKIDWQNERELARGRKVWRAEAEKYLPYSTPFLDGIAATSRRGYMKQAAAYHEANKGFLEKQGQAHVETAKAQAKAEAQEAWGRATTGPGTAPLDVSAAQAQWEEARARRDPLGMLKARGFHKLVD